MKVSELIAELQKVPQDWDVTMYCNNQYGFPVSVEARQDMREAAVFIMDEEATK